MIEYDANTPSKSLFAQRKDDILKRLQSCASNLTIYKGRKELANEKDENVAELCETLDEALSYGLRQQNNFVVTAASLFQNMQEIVTGNTASNMSNEASFWDFCQLHLTAHERERFENLKHVWTKPGRGKAFVRAALNESSLQRYFLTWLSDRELLERYYTHWSLLLDEEISKEMIQLLGNLNEILFALTVDAIELNKAINNTNVLPVVTKEEPIIFAPIPKPSIKSKRRTNAIERPIATANSTEDLMKNLGLSLGVKSETKHAEETQDGLAELAAEIIEVSQQKNLPCDPIEPELEFLKQPLPDFYIDNQSNGEDFEDKSDSSSEYSKTSISSTTNDGTAANCAILEEKLRQMNERYALLETRVAQLTLENRQLLRRLKRYFDESGIDPSSSFATNFLITIPTVKLIKPGHASSSYYAYDVHITMKNRLEHWSVLRRYSDFHKLHKTLLRTHPSVATVSLPPKKHFGNKNLVFVEERRQQLQIYLLSLVESLPQVEACRTKLELQKAFPFVRER